MSWIYIEDKSPQARKPHTCFLCEYDISAGSKYIRRTGTSDGSLLTFAMHLECEDLTKDWDEDDWLYHEPCQFRADIDKTQQSTETE